MKRVHCIVEGQTEVKVFYSILNPYIYEKTGAYVEFTPIKHTKGGIVQFDKIFLELRNHLSEKEKIVTTFFDYYGILPSHRFKNYKEAKIIQSNPHVGADLLERGMVEYLEEKGVDTRDFVPYVQLHEFEALLFSSDKGFEYMYDHARILDGLKDIRNRFPNPEDINDSPTTAPSKRLISILKRNNENYDKVVDGELRALEIGIETIIEKCPRFNNWVNQLIKKINE